MKSFAVSIACSIAAVASGCHALPLTDAMRSDIATDDGLLPSDRAAAACVAVAESFDEAGREPQALRMYERAVELGADRDVHAARMAVLYARAGRPAEADAHFRLATREDRDNADLWNDYGYFLFTIGSNDRAAAALRQAIKTDPAHPRARHNLEAVDASLTQTAGTRPSKSPAITTPL